MKTKAEKDTTTLDLFPLTLKTLGFGVPFRFAAKGFNTRLHMRVKPVNWILNSTLINDCINTGRCLVVAIEMGTLFVVPGDREVSIIDAELVYDDASK